MVEASPGNGALKVVEVDLSFLGRYRAFGVDVWSLGRRGSPVVVRHGNVAEFVLGMKPEVSSSLADVKRGVRLWEELLFVIWAYGSPGEVPGRGYAIGYFYPGVVVVSPKVPAFSTVPSWLAYIAGGEAAVVRNRDVENWRKFYVRVLRRLSKAVIVKPPPYISLAAPGS